MKCRVREKYPEFIKSIPSDLQDFQISLNTVPTREELLKEINNLVNEEEIETWLKAVPTREELLKELMRKTSKSKSL